MRFKDIVDSVPRWDGHKPGVFQFSKIRERAAKLIPPQQETYLVQLIINKLQWHAYTAVEGVNFSTVASLTLQLKKIFGPNKSLNQYRGELGNLYMLPNEDIFSYVEASERIETHNCQRRGKFIRYSNAAGWQPDRSGRSREFYQRIAHRFISSRKNRGTIPT